MVSVFIPVMLISCLENQFVYKPKEYLNIDVFSYLNMFVALPVAR